ncbi:retrovirus-related pol polyprotein from transposon TNT 1-94 [Tanacetum coccineum]
MYALTVSTIEPKNIKEAMADHSWIESMQDELNQFERLQVWELVLQPEGKNIIALKWLWKNKEDILLVQVYVDDIIFGSTNPDFSKCFANLMKNNFEMSMMGELKFFLGLQVHQSPRGIFISQSQYAIELLKKHGLDECVSMSTPMATERLDADLQGTPTDQTTYRRMIGGLMYLTASRPDIAFATFICARYQARPTVKHLKEDSRFELIAYSDADHAGCKDDCKSTSGGLQFLKYQLADLFTKALPKERFEYLVHRIVIIMAQQQHAADVHPDELCPPNKRYDLMDANKKVDLEHETLLLSQSPTSSILYLRFTKIIISHYMTSFPEILKRDRDRYHNLKDDDIMKNIFNSGRYKDKVGMKIPDWMISEENEAPRRINQMYGVVEKSKKLEKMWNSIEIEKMVEGSENVIDDSLLHRNDEPKIPGTRLEPRSDKESPEVEINKDKEVEITNDEEVEITNVVILVMVMKEKKIIDEAYELNEGRKEVINRGVIENTIPHTK